MLGVLFLLPVWASKPHMSKDWAPSNQSNMNGGYLYSQTPGGHDTQRLFPAQFRDYPGGVMSFDVYTPPIKTFYSQVFWTGLDPVGLPDDIVKYFDGKDMAVVGFELDQVRRTEEGDVSVPINVAYNHHFESTMAGSNAIFEKVPKAADDETSAQRWVVRDLKPGGATPNSQDFGAANGGETRKSFHGYAPGFAQVIHSPKTFQVTAMQIDTWNRDKMKLTGSDFVAGPEPRSSLAPPNATYSGLLECPLTTRINKVLRADYTIKSSGLCDSPVLTAADCFAGAGKLLPGNWTQTTVNDPTQPAGCSLKAQENFTVDVIFNAARSSVPCGSAVARIVGAMQSLVRLELALDVERQVATISVTGPVGVWFGVGFNASAMKDAPWAVIVDGYGGVTERKLADQNPGVQLAPSVTVTANTTSGNTRTLVLSRPFKGKSSDYFSFSASLTSLAFINAIGNGPTLAYHKIKTPSTIVLLPANSTGDCVCSSPPPPFGKAVGTLVYVKTSQPEDTGSGTINFDNDCEPWPKSQLLEAKNPTCDLRTYVGGQIACHHMFSLLDADQPIPWVDQPLEYVLKFRFWVQEYDASYHRQVFRTTWGIASPVEFDVPQCADGIEGCAKEADGTWVHTIAGTFTGNGALVHASFHCHAPTCLSMTLYRCPLGTTVCNASTGQLLCEERPVYGTNNSQPFNEVGFILQPPCLWGSPEFGLEAPPNVTGYVLGSVKKSNATFGHHGEMAWLQMLYA